MLTCCVDQRSSRTALGLGNEYLAVLALWVDMALGHCWSSGLSAWNSSEELEERLITDTPPSPVEISFKKSKQFLHVIELITFVT